MPAPRFFHLASIFTLFAWSAIMLYFYASGRVAHLLKGAFQIGPLIGGLGLAAVGFFNLFRSKVEEACCHHPTDDHRHHEPEPDHGQGENAHPCAAGGDHDHHSHDREAGRDGHSHDDPTVPGIVATLVIVLVPAVGAAALAQNSFSLEALANKGLYDNSAQAPAGAIPLRDAKGLVTLVAPPADAPNDATETGAPAQPANEPRDADNLTPPANDDRYTLADLEKQVRKSDEGNFLIPVTSLFYSAADEELADVLAGQPIETTGQVAPEIPENDPRGTRLRVYRLFIQCCLADARPVGLSADFGKAPPKFPEDSWVKIIGKMAYPKQDGRPVPILQVEKIEAIASPEGLVY